MGFGIKSGYDFDEKGIKSGYRFIENEAQSKR